MTHNEKIRHLLEDFGRRGINRFTTAPPLYRLLWRFGFEAVPPHFAGFLSLAVLAGAYFGMAFAIIVWFTGVPVLVAAGGGGIVGPIFGVTLAAYYRRQNRKLNLARWEDYPPGT